MTKIFTVSTMIVLGLLCLTVQAAQRDPNRDIQQLYSSFKGWMTEHNKQFGIDELFFRFNNWKQNQDFVNEHNQKDLPYKVGMNEYAHMTPEEFSALHLGFNRELHARSKQQNTNIKANGLKALRDDNSSNATNATNATNASNASNTTNATNGTNATANASADANSTLYQNLPASIDWRNKGAVAPVENQSICGACWAFSATGALTGLNAIKNKQIAVFSKQQLVDCAGGDYGNMGCSGGLMASAFNYTKDQGIQLEADYPYTAQNGTCVYNSSKTLFKNTGFELVQENSTLAMMAAVAKQPVSIAIEASSRSLQLFHSGIYTTGCGLDLDHGVLIVGYDTDINGTDFWIVKNSWSAKWGLNGYINIARGDQNNGAGVCGINCYGTYPTL